METQREYEKKTSKYKKINLEINQDIFDFIILQAKKENKTIKKITNEILLFGWIKYQSK